MESLNDTTLTESLAIGPAFAVPRWLIIAYVVNHGTQHRSEVAHYLIACGHSPGNLDLLDTLALKWPGDPDIPSHEAMGPTRQPVAVAALRVSAMDKAALQDFFAYTGWAWDQIREAIPDDETLRAVAPGSGWPTLRHCLAHIVLAYDRWVPAIVELKSRPLPNLAPGDFLTWPQIESHRRRTRGGLQSHLEAWTGADLHELHDVDVDDEPVRYSRGELITHLLLHERGHHGDVTTLFWQLGFDSETILEYRFHLGRH